MLIQDVLDHWGLPSLAAVEQWSWRCAADGLTRPLRGLHLHLLEVILPPGSAFGLASVAMVGAVAHVTVALTVAELVAGRSCQRLQHRVLHMCDPMFAEAIRGGQPAAFWYVRGACGRRGTQGNSATYA